MAMSAKEISEMLNMALKIELEGRMFYLSCMEKTAHSGGKEMFRFLAQEEWIHYETVERIYRREFEKEYLQYKKTQPESSAPSGIFQKKVAGGRADAKADALDALNIAIKAEDNSVQLYKRLADGVKNARLAKVFKKLVEEEKKHFLILENEVESLTNTGSYTDFKIVTS